ncbi:MAG: sigma-70 family RNA polymerase sigma factor [Gemmatimonadetes bacterium]|nr:sigma-70 family RNA polymerase sigma factor [Gemmatimonadota bacterium]
MRNAPPSFDGERLEVLRSGLRIVALRSLGDLEAAEEAAQETLVRGLEALEQGRLENPQNPGAYFRGILRHVIADTIRQQRRTVSLEAVPEIPVSNPSSDALQHLISGEQREAVAHGMAELSPRARECLRLCFFHGLPPREVAVRLGEPASRIRKRRSRALRQMGEILLRTEGPPKGHEITRTDTREARESEPAEAKEPGRKIETRSDL